MKSKNIQPVKSDIPVSTGIPNKLQWAEFIADVWFKCWVLMLVTIALVGGMVVVWVVVWYGKDPTGVIIASITGGAIAGLGKLYQVVIKPRLDAGKE
jgi:hypothetical protein